VDKDYLVECIKEEGESSFFDYKKDIYDFKNSKEKEEFIKDILCFANGYSVGDKYIITGVKLQKDNSTRELCGITEDKIQDGAIYQNLIDDNIEPSIIIDFTIIKYDDKKFGIFKIGKENIDKPYMLKKKFENLEVGFMKMRLGQRNVNITRRDLDKMYNSKVKEKMSDIALKGIVNDEISDYFEIKHIEEEILTDCKLQKQKEEIILSFNTILKIQVEEKSNSLFSSYSIGNKVEIDEDVKEEIIKFSKEFNIVINDDFFKLGNLTKLSFGTFYNLNGTENEEKKYELINILYKKITIYNGIKDLKRKFDKLYYCELLVKNMGDKFDDDINITLKIEKENFIDYNNFPVPNESIIKKITDYNFLDKWIKIKKHSNVNEHEYKKITLLPIYPKKYYDGLHNIYPDPKEYIDYYYDYLKYLTCYDIVSDNNNYYIKFVINKINPNQMIFLPCRLFFNKNIKAIEYEINSKYNPEIKKGKIEILEG